MIHLLFEQSGTFRDEFRALGYEAQDGDYFKKPTQFWFVGFRPQCNLVLEPLQHVKRKRVEKLRPNSKERSEIHPQYARRFIKQYILQQ